ncbi:MAG: hypothetical protein ACYCZF_13785 [Anaerolineae bacterium]
MSFSQGWNAALNKWRDLLLDANDNLLTNPGASSGLTDSFDLSRTTKGVPTVTHNGLTVPSLSVAVDTTGYNGLLVLMRVTAWTSGTVSFLVQGALDAANYYPCYAHSGAGVIVMSGDLGAVSDRLQVYRGIPDSIKINVSGTFVATYSCTVQPIVL